MKMVFSFSFLVVALAVPAAAHAQAGSPPEDHAQHQAQVQDHSQHPTGPAGVGRNGPGTPSAAPHQMGMMDCKCCCCEAMRKKMQEHGRGAEAESHQADR